MYISSFYIAHSSQKPLTWSQQLHNIGAELLHFPILHKHFDQIDTTTLERTRVTTHVSAGKILELVVKVMLAATILIPLISFAISRPTASNKSWAQVDILFSQLEKEDKKDFLYAFLTKKEIEVDSPFTKLHLIAKSYRNSNLEADLISQLIRLDASVFEEVKNWQEAQETLYATANSYLHLYNPQLSLLYPYLTGTDQIRVLQQLQTREKDLLKLFPLSVTAALENPGQLLQCLIPRELPKGSYSTTLDGNNLFHTEKDLKLNIPKAYSAIEALLTKLPPASIVGIFWKTAKCAKSGMWGKNRAVTANNLSLEERSAVKALSFDKIALLNDFTQPWIKLWLLLEPSPESLHQACFSLDHDAENRFNQENNRNNFLNLLSLEDLRVLIAQDPDCNELAKIFGTCREEDYKNLNRRLDEVEIPHILMRWWDKYDEVDFHGRFKELSTFLKNPFLLQYFEVRHQYELKAHPYREACKKEWSERYAFIRQQVSRGNHSPCSEDFELWKRVQEAIREKEQAEQRILLTLKTAIEGLGLDPRREYTQDEIVREYRRWSRMHHPDRDKTGGATERFRQATDYKNSIIEILEMKKLSKTPIIR